MSLTSQILNLHGSTALKRIAELKPLENIFNPIDYEAIAIKASQRGDVDVLEYCAKIPYLYPLKDEAFQGAHSLPSPVRLKLIRHVIDGAESGLYTVWGLVYLCRAFTGDAIEIPFFQTICNLWRATYNERLQLNLDHRHLTIVVPMLERCPLFINIFLEYAQEAHVEMAYTVVSTNSVNVMTALLKVSRPQVEQCVETLEMAQVFVKNGSKFSPEIFYNAPAVIEKFLENVKNIWPAQFRSRFLNKIIATCKITNMKALLAMVKGGATNYSIILLKIGNYEGTAEIVRICLQNPIASYQVARALVNVTKDLESFTLLLDATNLNIPAYRDKLMYAILEKDRPLEFIYAVQKRVGKEIMVAYARGSQSWHLRAPSSIWAIQNAPEMSNMISLFHITEMCQYLTKKQFDAVLRRGIRTADPPWVILEMVLYIQPSQVATLIGHLKRLGWLQSYPMDISDSLMRYCENQQVRNAFLNVLCPIYEKQRLLLQVFRQGTIVHAVEFLQILIERYGPKKFLTGQVYDCEFARRVYDFLQKTAI